MLGTCAASVGLEPWVTLEIKSRVSVFMHTLDQFNTLSHSLPLQQTHLNTGLLNTEIQANLVRNKANKMVDKIQPYRLGGSIAVYVSQLHFLVNCLLLGGRRRGFTPRVSVSSSITHRVLSLCLHLSSLYLFLLFFIMDVILIGIDCLPILY